MKSFTVLLLVALAALAHAGTFKAPALSGKWHSAKKTYDLSSSSMPITLVLKQSNLKALETLVLDVSDPTSKNYGKHLTAAQVNEMTRPLPETYRLVHQWLQSENLAGKARATQGGSALKIDATVKDVERAFNTKVDMVTNGMKVKARAGDYTLPAGLEEHVVAVFGMHGLPLPHNKFVASANGPASVTPEVIGKTYNTSNAHGSSNKKNRQAVGEYQGQNALDTDTAAFFQKYVKGASAEDAKLYKVVGTDSQGYAGVEASLDVEYIMGVAPKILTEFWGYQQQDFCKDMQQFTAKILDTTDAPNVFSISYGWQGQLSQLGCQDNEIDAVDTNFQKLAARGISMIIASGDTGAAYAPFQNTLYPSWPASSPWVTSVGATRFVNQDPSQPEMATDQFGSGGGFSKMFDRSNAKWQEQHVQNYLSIAKGLPPSKVFDSKGRATPDVSALGEGYEVVSNGRTMAVGGTSASTPCFAGVVSLLNEARAKRGMSALGFLNPFIYSNPQAFTDITRGSNKIDRSGGPMKYGYETAKGWDPVTGMGTPLFGQLLTAALKK